MSVDAIHKQCPVYISLNGDWFTVNFYAIVDKDAIILS